MVEPTAGSVSPDDAADTDGLVDLLPVAVVCLDSAGNAVFVNSTWAQLNGSEAPANLGAGWLDVFRPAERDGIESWVQEAVRGQLRASREVHVHTTAGDRLLLLVGQPHHGRDGTLRSYVLCGSDVTEQVAREGRLAYEATHDPLTGLANRAELDRRTAMLACDRSRAGGGVGMLCLDLDDFAAVNAAGGHAAGDEVLCVVAARLESVVRPLDVVARYGGDEFALLVADIATPARARAIAQRVLECLAEPIEVRGEPWELRASVGIALSRGGQASDLLDRADTSLYAAKARARSAGRTGDIVIAADGGSPTRSQPAGRPSMEVHPGVAKASPAFHAVHFYDDDADLLPAVAGYVSAGLFEDCVTVIATPEHRRQLNARLDPTWVAAARAEHRYIELDAHDTLGRIMRDGLPDRHLFESFVGTAIRRALATHERVRGYGEMAGLLLADGQLAAALALEDMLHDIQRHIAFPVLCAYPRSGFALDRDDGFGRVCSRHTQLLLAG